MAKLVLLSLSLVAETAAFQSGLGFKVGIVSGGVASNLAFTSPIKRGGLVAAAMGGRERGKDVSRREKLSIREAASTSIVSEQSILAAYEYTPGMKVVCDGRNMCVLVEEEETKPSTLDLKFWIPRFLILGCCMIYGSNFAFGQMLLETAPASVVSGLRFSLAGIALAPFLMQIDRKLIKPGIVIGMLLAFGYLGQSIALTTIAAGKVGFFCALSVLVCPILEVLFDGKKLSAGLIGAAFFALLGVGLMEMSHGALPGLGDLWAFAQPLGFGSAYWLTAKTLRKHPKQTLALTALQTCVVGSVATAWMLSSAFLAGTLFSGAFIAPVLSSAGAIFALLYTGLFTTAFARIGETRALGKLSSSEASILMATEPLWAALFAAVLVSEVITMSAVQGGALIMLGCVLSTADKGIGRAWLRLRVKGRRGIARLERISGRLGWGGGGA
eukprot:CAMPEP_0196736582 /NCGR_PEP_ID=MMETSP1091-20130531/14604_1 /TAXON_ID=302021 /ORGANISM="Rhodomonas sp., Strain CCMP768" /LENGTH=442 /DNA_ID=CAMNT_0042080337 /DNA_START=26 /DNA_END=1354 /DNA_ORIENTATION=+